MQQCSLFSKSDFRFGAMALLTACVVITGCAMQNQSSSAVGASGSTASGMSNTRIGVVTDWTSHNVIFSNPGTLQDAITKGRREEWQHIVSDPRYQMQLARRNTRTVGQMVTPLSASSEEAEANTADASRFKFPGIGPRWPRLPLANQPLNNDWEVQIAGGAGGSVAADMYAAKYSFSPIGDPDCTSDYVVFPVSANGQNTQQGNIVGFNNLYSGTCTGTVPTPLFFYFVGTGAIKTSPVLSLDGTKIAFVESVTGGSRFHVLTIDQRGNSGCPNDPCNGSNFNNTAVPGVNNSAVDVPITMSGNVSDTRSSPYVDYTNDIAYVGDDNGVLHKFTGVFTGTPAEVTTAPWPFTVAGGAILTSPVFDSGLSQNIFVGGSDGNLYCVTTAGAACPTPSIVVGTGSTPAILDGPLVDSTTEKVFVEANTGSNAQLTEATAGLGARIDVNIGLNGTDLYNGAFDNSYFTSGGTGNLYVCGNLSTAATPQLYQVAISGGLISGTTASLQLVRTGQTGPSNDCTPFTEIFNTSLNEDLLFAGVKDNGAPAACDQNTCILSTILPTSGLPTAILGLHNSSFGPNGLSGIIIDNVSGVTGASQIYFGNLQNNSAVQASQTATQ